MTAESDDRDGIEEMSFEKALEELEAIVEKLESGKAGLEDSIRLYERGERLKARCEALLKQAEAKVEKITLDAGGKPKGTERLDVDQ